MELSKKRKLRIPKSFKIFGQTIRVRFDKDLIENEEIYGLSCFETNEITLQTPGSNLTQTQVEVTFLHEMIHMILSNASFDKESKNERLVDTLANLIHQVMKTSIYSKDNDSIINFGK